MELILDLKKLEKSNLSLKKFVYLQTLVDEIEIDTDFLGICREDIEDLQRDLYIKVLEDGVFLRQKALDLFNIKQQDITFKEFWDKYHEITGKPKTDRVPAEKYWRRLSKKHKKLAMEMIQPFFNSLDNPKYCKKARTYLDHKNYLDEYLIDQEKLDDDPFLQKA